MGFTKIKKNLRFYFEKYKKIEAIEKIISPVIRGCSLRKCIINAKGPPSTNLS
jgi:hypothetical protein